MSDPSLSLERARATWQKHRRSEKWIQQRMTGQETRNTHHLTVTGKHGFMIAQMNTEQPGEGQTNPRNAWQKLVSDVNDPDSLGIGDINYWVVIGGVGAVDTFTKNGGTGIRTRRIGSAP